MVYVQNIVCDKGDWVTCSLWRKLEGLWCSHEINIKEEGWVLYPKQTTVWRWIYDWHKINMWFPMQILSHTYFPSWVLIWNLIWNSSIENYGVNPWEKSITNWLQVTVLSPKDSSNIIKVVVPINLLVSLQESSPRP